MKKIGVILAGSGYLDGAEIREAVLSLLSIDKCGAQAVIFAPNKIQHHVVNHLDMSDQSGQRNVLEEAARIARGKVQDLKMANADELDALIIPGGFGVAKNLSTLAFDGPNGSIDEDFKKILLDMNHKGKPIGAICIAPAVICYALGQKGVEVTIGNDEGTAQAIEALGGKHFNCKANEIHIDGNLKVVSTPAYMYDDGKLSDIAEGIDKCVKTTLEMA